MGERSRIFLVTLLVCIACSVVVSSLAVLLRPAQEKNKQLDLQRNILSAAGLLEKGAGAARVRALFANITPRLVDLDRGQFVGALSEGAPSVADYDQRRAQRDPALSRALGKEEDIAVIRRREKYSLVYTVEEGGDITRLILPVRGYGLWSTLYGFVALERDGNTILGLGFYEHGETPGLGGEVDNAKWKAQWVGKRIYRGAARERVAIEVLKGRADKNSPSADYQIDGLTGATLTTRGVDNMMEYWFGEQGYARFLRNFRPGA